MALSLRFTSYTLPNKTAGLAENSLALLLFVAAGASPATNPLVQKLASHVAAGPARSRFGPLCVSVGGFEAPLAARGLSAYDVAAGSAAPALALNASAVANGSQVRLFSAVLLPAHG